MTTPEEQGGRVPGLRERIWRWSPERLRYTGDRDRRPPDEEDQHGSRLGQWISGPTFYPTVAFVVVLLGALVLIFQINLRPWATPDNSYESHFNTMTLDSSYKRTTVGMVEGTPGPLEPWAPNVDEAEGDDTGLAEYVAYMCASCHGFAGEGNRAGPPVAGGSVRRVTTLTRKGPGHMPAYDEVHLLPDEMDAIGAYLERLPEIPEPTPPVAAPTPTPYPTATPTPGPTATPAPTPLPTATPLPPGAPTPTPTPTPLPTPAPTPTPTPDPVRFEAGRGLYIDVGCDLCHGEAGEGNEKGPHVLGYTTEFLFDYTRAPDAAVEEWEPMEFYTTTDVSDEELNEIIYYLLSLPGN